LSNLSSSVKIFKRPEDALFDVPAYLIENRSKNKSEESMSEQMLSGIPEVDLGVDERIRNIEDTERAKQKVGKKLTSGGGRCVQIQIEPPTPPPP
jgi:hypothetical protein